MKRYLLLLLFFLPLIVYGQRWQSDIVPIVDGRLTYVNDADHNRIPNYSHAGYKGGGLPIPAAPVKVTISPSAGDRTSDIQAAIDEVGRLAPDADGIRGAVLLKAGKYMVDGTLRIDVDGIVVRGVGDGPNEALNTILYRNDPSISDDFFSIGIGKSWSSGSNKLAGSETNITTNFVQVGSCSFEVANASMYNVGDHIVVYHPDADDWLAALDYGAVGTQADADPWSSGETETVYNRYITAIHGNTITIDAPVFMHLDRSLSQAYIYKIDESTPVAIRNIGIEKLRVEVATNGDNTTGHCSIIMKFDGVENFWVDQVTGVHFSFSLIKCNSSVRGTIMNCQAIEPHNTSGGMRYNYQISDRAQLLLLKDNFSSYGTVDFTNGGSGRYSAGNSGNVYLNNITWRSRSTSFDNHVRWYTGNLFDCNKNIEDQGERAIFLGNRGHWTDCGWGAAFCTAWNFDGESNRLNIQGVPTGQNYAIGCHGSELGNFKRRSFFADAPDAYYEGFNVDGIFPQSLYLAQLQQRLDPNHLLDINNPEYLPVKRINLFNEKREFVIGESHTLIASVVPADATNKSIVWTSTNPEIATVNNGIVTAKAGGSVFIVANSANNLAKDSVEVVVQYPTAFVDFDKDTGINVYPNPAAGMITIRGLKDLTKIEIVDVIGCVVLQKTVGPDNNQLDISGLITGVYTIRFNYTKDIRKIVKL